MDHTMTGVPNQHLVCRDISRHWSYNQYGCILSIPVHKGHMQGNFPLGPLEWLSGGAPSLPKTSYL